MPLVVTDVGEKVMLDYVRAGSVLSGANLHLYKNNYLPVDSSVAADFTVATFTGYGGAILGSGVAATTVGGKAYVPFTQRTFSVSANGGPSNSIYGYYIYNSGTGQLLFAERFAAGPYTMANLGDTLKLTPTLTLFSEY